MGNDSKPCRLGNLAKKFFNALELAGCRQVVCCRRLEEASETRDRIMQTARRIFSEKGASATVREICTEAKANVSAVNYHFGNKEKLLAAVLEQYLDETIEVYPLLGRVEPTAPVEERFFGFILSCMSRLLLGQGDEDLGMNKLIIEAFANNFEEFRPAAERHWETLHDTVLPMVDELTGKKWNIDQLEKLSSGFFSQMFFYAMHQDELVLLRSGKHLSESDVAGIAQHITALSLGGMTHYSEYMDADMDFPNLFGIEHCTSCGKSSSVQ